MEGALVPLALLGLFGGLINLPAYLGAGWLAGFFSTLPGGHEAEASHSLEISLQAIAGVLALAGLGIAHMRYGKAHRQERISAAEGEESGAVAFFRNGWRFDDLYRVLFIRPYEALAGFLWRQVDQGVIDGSLDRLASFLGRSGEGLGAWTNGKVTVYIISFAAGAALLMAYMAWFLI